MPITLDKLFSPKATVSFPFLGETVHLDWSPWRFTGEMQDLADKLIEENDQDREAIARTSAELEELRLEAVRLLGFPEGSAEYREAAEVQSKAAVKSDELDKLRFGLDRRDKQHLRRLLAGTGDPADPPEFGLLVGWDVLGADGKPLPITADELNRLPDAFIRTMWFTLSSENQPDPQKAPASDDGSSTETISAPSRTGTHSSAPRARSKSHRSSSTKGRGGRASTPSGASGH